MAGWVFAYKNPSGECRKHVLGRYCEVMTKALVRPSESAAAAATQSLAAQMLVEQKPLVWRT